MPRVSIDWDDKSSFKYQPSYSARKGSALIFIYIGSSECACSNQEELPQKIDRLKILTQTRASENDQVLVTIGIAKDWKTREGLKHLSKFGEFDEIMTGRSWVNEGIMKYIWEGSEGEPATPHIVLMERFLAVPSSERSNYEIHDERLVVRKVGIGAIQQWLDLEAPLPSPADSI